MSDGNRETVQQPTSVREEDPREDRERLFRERLWVLTPAPDFTVQDVTGRQVSLSDYKRKEYVVLEFGAIT